MIYIEYTFNIVPVQPFSDVLIAQLGEVGFESFTEENTGVSAYIQKQHFKEGILDTIELMSSDLVAITYDSKEIAQENWNSTWEQNFNPITVADLCTVRAPFHEKTTTQYDIVIEPKMSFGTGHHETTHMMLAHLIELSLDKKSVLDMGSGTGVLAIMAALRGATVIDAIDIDHWCYLNAIENTARNNVDFINVLEGDASLLVDKKYDLIIANINRNILINDIPVYAASLNAGGVLLLSGFYKEDLGLINDACKNEGLQFKKNIGKNNWVAAKYVI